MIDGLNICDSVFVILLFVAKNQSNNFQFK